MLVKTIERCKLAESRNSMASSLFASLIGNLNVLKEEVDEQVITLPTLHSNSVRYLVDS